MLIGGDHIGQYLAQGRSRTVGIVCKSMHFPRFISYVSLQRFPIDFVLSKDKQPTCMCQVRGLREFINVSYAKCNLVFH